MLTLQTPVANENLLLLRRAIEGTAAHVHIAAEKSGKETTLVTLVANTERDLFIAGICWGIACAHQHNPPA